MKKALLLLSAAQAMLLTAQRGPILSKRILNS